MVNTVDVIFCHDLDNALHFASWLPFNLVPLIPPRLDEYNPSPVLLSIFSIYDWRSQNSACSHPSVIHLMLYAYWVY